MEDRTVFTFAAPEIAEFMHNNGIDVVDLLSRQGLEVRREPAEDVAQLGTKDATMVILASAAVVGTLQPVLKQLLEGLLYRPIRVTELVPVETPSDAEGAPAKIVWVERTSVIENPPPKDKSKLVVGFAGFKFEYETDAPPR